LPPRSYSVAEIRAAEQPLLDAGVPLMTRAAHALAGQIRDLGRSPVIVLAGAGDNGGDALYAAAELAPERDVWMARVTDRVHSGGWAAAIANGVREVAPDAVAALLTGTAATDGAVIVDGMRGIGGAGAGLRDVARATALGIRSLDTAPKPYIVAVDVPSGIDADTGAADDAVLPADLTVTFGALKRGLTIEPARSLAGRILLVDIGLGLPG
jgi:hydroxyethylthiazole kinase-like uncharacterized protein yjeF